MICVSAVYTNRPGSRFDGDYYLTQHARLAEELLKPMGLLAVRLSVGKSDLSGGPPPFWAISEMHFATLAAFDAAMLKCGDALFQDAKNYTDVEPVLQVSVLQVG